MDAYWGDCGVRESAVAAAKSPDSCSRARRSTCDGTNGPRSQSCGGRAVLARRPRLRLGSRASPRDQLTVVWVTARSTTRDVKDFEVELI